MDTQQTNGELITTQALEVIESAESLAIINKSEIDQQIATAKAYPRSIKSFRSKALELATLDIETAESCYFVLPRGGKTIEGPSIRLAEIVTYAWGNLRYGSRVIGVDSKFIEAEGFAFDLETNTAVKTSVRRRITDKSGRRFNDDMIVMTGNAACSIAARNAIFRVIPRAFVDQICKAAKDVVRGDVKTLSERRDRAISWLQEKGCKLPDILKTLGRQGVEDITLDDLVILSGVKTAITDGDTKPEYAFNNKTEQEVPAINERLKDLRADMNQGIARKAPAKKELEKAQSVMDADFE